MCAIGYLLFLIGRYDIVIFISCTLSCILHFVLLLQAVNGAAVCDTAMTRSHGWNFKGPVREHSGKTLTMIREIDLDQDLSKPQMPCDDASCDALMLSSSALHTQSVRPCEPSTVAY